MFLSVKAIKKEDLKLVAEEIGEIVLPTAKITDLKDLILNSEAYEKDPDFVKDILENAVAERLKLHELELSKFNKQQELELSKFNKQQELELLKLQQDREREFELEKLKLAQERELELEKIKLNNELELARIQIQAQNSYVINQPIPEANNSKKKFTLPKLQFRQFGDDLKDWLPFWSQFEHIDKDSDIAPENKFQYLVQATVIGSRAREVVESFPPTGENYSKAVDSLKTRFGREDILVEVYVRELLKLIISVQSNQKLSPTSLYDKLESYLRALETLGVTTDKCASILYPMVESCFDEEFLKAWNRSPTSSSAKDPKERLDNLMSFLKGEVEGEERISLAMSGFGLTKNEDTKEHRKKKNFEPQRVKTPTASALLTSTKTPEIKKNKCIFCDGKHASAECFNAQKLSLEEKQKIVRDKNCCFACLLPGHSARKCRVPLKCLICSKKHVPLMCDQLHSNKTSQKKEEVEYPLGNDVNLSNLNSNPKVFLQTFKAKLLSSEKEKTVRVLCDSGSQNSYILKNIAEEMKYSICRQETIIHSLFGGVSTRELKHNCYKIKLKQLNGSFSCNFEVLDQPVICDSVTPVKNGPWLDELKDLGIVLTDANASCAPIQVLIGADILGKLLTGKRKVLSSGLVAVETHLGWTLMGKVPQKNAEKVNLAMSVTSLFVKEAEISDLWKLDVIGIKDPIEKKSKLEQDLKTKEHFRETMKINEDKRYEVCLPWSDDSSPLPDNFSLAKKRLDSTTEKLLSRNLYDKYDKVFQEWLDAGIIEEVPPNEVAAYGNYMPHRPVIKESSSTPIRPVFDASAKMKNYPSLNQCLQCGPNLIELIPDILIRFREKKFGVTADIRKAFLQISVSKEDRDFLRFLWWKNLEKKTLKVFRHARVVFGVKSSPFLLSSVIDYHIENTEGFDSEFKKILQKSFYVDNVVTSFDSRNDLNTFISKSNELMSLGGFLLRDWKYKEEYNSEHDLETPVLGLKWNRQLDSLKVNMSWMKELDLEKITKRVILSVAHKVFDPIGYTAPVMLCPKLVLQKTWKMDIGWDTEITGTLKKEFLQWFKELKSLEHINIPRWINVTEENLKNCTMHTFCDASKDAYAAVVFLRLEEEDSVKLSLLAAKSRIAPLRGGTIPRMELLAALVGARLTDSVLEALNWNEIECYYWSDSTTVLAWIQREENWSVFVRNRVQEIRKLTSPSSWNHVATELNPADLPSRGCTASQLVSLRWWEGPQWLTKPKELWHHQNIDKDIDEEEILKEKLKTTKSMANIETNIQNNGIYSYFSKYQQIVRLVGWILRFKHNCLSRKEERTCGELGFEEFQKAERKLVKMIQQESFDGCDDKRFKGLAVFEDEDKILRIKTQIINRKDTEDFRKPMLLPSSHKVVLKLIDHYHKSNLHCGLQILQNLIREKFWILNGRRTMRKVIHKCVICKRFSSQKLETDSAPLPENRVRDAAVFQITGVDATGPLFLKGGQKSWVLLFTCAIYRAVHLELVTSLSTEAFLMAFRRFVARRGRCSTMYCDNGTNFTGAANLLRGLDWNKIVKYGAVRSIDWKFNPPTASWWGGWWERLIRILKDLLKRVLGRAELRYEEMATILCDCEALMNSRPLTYQSDDQQLLPLSPSSFLQDIKEWSTPDVDAVDHQSLNRRIKYRQNLQKDLRNRFRSEYLGLLIQRKKRKDTRNIAIGDIVLIGADNVKRINWPLGRVAELIPGKDGRVRLVRVQTSHSKLLRPIQRIYPLEISSASDFPTPAEDSCTVKDKNENILISNTKVSRSGREIKIPERLGL